MSPTSHVSDEQTEGRLSSESTTRQSSQGYSEKQSHIGADSHQGPPLTAAAKDAPLSVEDSAPITTTTPDGEATDPEKATPSSADQQYEPEAGRSKTETVLVVFALCLALFLAALDSTITTTAVPTISAHFHSSAGYIWIGSAYLLGNATFIPTWGKISDIFGRKPVLLSAIVIFWVGSLLCATSVSMGMLIAARAIQGVGSGGAIVLPNICISDLFSMRNRGKYFGMLGVVWAISSALGPILGGVFTEKVSWRWCFYINLPVSGVGFIILVFVLKLHNPRTPMKEGLQAIDWIGSLLCVGGTLMFLLGLQFGGSQFPWDSATVICLVVFGAATVGLFTIYEWKMAKYPVVPLHIFKYRNSVASYMGGFLHAFTFMAGSYWLPLYFQGVLGATPLLSGVYIIPYAVSLSICSAGSGMIIKRTGNFKIPINAGFLIMVLGFGLFIDLGPTANWAKIILYEIVAGIGVGPNFQALLISLQTNVEPRDIGSATSSFSFLRQLGTSTSVVIGGVIFNNQMQSQHATLDRELPAGLAHTLTDGDAIGSVAEVGALQGHDGRVAKQAFWNSLKIMFVCYTCFAALGLAVSLLIRQTRLKKDHKEHKTGLQTLRARKGSTAETQQTTQSVQR